jgi:transcription elongation factor GreA
MPNEKAVILTSAGLEKYETELEYLKSEKRLEIAEKIKEARAFGDLSENAEYDAAKKEQAEIEERISKIENMLKRATVVEQDSISTTSVNVGSMVTLLDIEDNSEVVYQIVGSNESDPFNNKISNESPIGSSLIGKKKGVIVDAETPGGIIQFKILKISK